MERHNEARRPRNTEIVAIALAVAATLGAAACSNQVAGSAEAGAPVTAHASAEPAPTTRPQTPEGPLATSEHLTNTNIPGETPFSFTLNSYDGETSKVTDRPDYDYALDVVKDANGTLTEWFCGGGGNKEKPAKERGDSIWVSQNAKDGVTAAWTKPVEVLKASKDPNALDSIHACDPSVVEHDGHYYVAYTGTAALDGTANRVFLARVPVNEAANPNAYQKLVNASGLNAPARPAYEAATTNDPPMPIIHTEPQPVWHVGTSQAGGAVRQSPTYGLGQPSMVLDKDGHLNIFYTSATTAGTQENIAIRWTVDLDNATAMVSTEFLRNDPANKGNEVDYATAYDPDINRYITAIAEEHPEAPKSELGAPRITPALQEGANLINIPAPIISNILGQKACNCYVGTTTDTHNLGLLTDGNGWLVKMPGHPGGPSYNWVYDSLNAGDPAHFDIDRLPFALTASPPK